MLCKPSTAQHLSEDVGGSSNAKRLQLCEEETRLDSLEEVKHSLSLLGGIEQPLLLCCRSASWQASVIRLVSGHQDRREHISKTVSPASSRTLALPNPTSGARRCPLCSSLPKGGQKAGRHCHSPSPQGNTTSRNHRGCTLGWLPEHAIIDVAQLVQHCRTSTHQRPSSGALAALLPTLNADMSLMSCSPCTRICICVISAASATQKKNVAAA